MQADIACISELVAFMMLFPMASMPFRIVCSCWQASLACILVISHSSAKNFQLLSQYFRSSLRNFSLLSQDSCIEVVKAITSLSISLGSFLKVNSGVWAACDVVQYFDDIGRLYMSDVSDMSTSASDCSSWALLCPVEFLCELFGSTSEVHRTFDMSPLFS
jgi:hypothetical protein